MTENMQMKGTQSIEFAAPVRIAESASVVGTKEGEGPLKEFFDSIAEDDLLGCETWEDAESTLVQEAISTILKKTGLGPQEIRYLFAGDLLAQSVASSYGVEPFGIPLFGLYGACSTSGLGLSVAAITIAGGFADRAIAVTSSHFASAEKEFRYPLDYGSQRPPCASWTVTGSGAFLLEADADLSTEDGTQKENSTPGKKKRRFSHCRITGVTTGRIVDYGIKDSMNMGCCMAPAAADTIQKNLQDFGRSPKDYDHIITGDLGSVGSQALYDLLLEKEIDIAGRHLDCGLILFDNERQGTDAGGSGRTSQQSIL